MRGGFFFFLFCILDIEDGVLGVHGRLVLGSLTDQSLFTGEGDERRRGKATLLIGDNLNISTFIGGNARVGRS